MSPIPSAPNSLSSLPNGKVPGSPGLFDDLKPATSQRFSERIRQRQDKTETTTSASTPTGPRIIADDQPMSPIEQGYMQWSSNPIPKNMNHVVGQLQPTINKAIQTFAPGSGELVKGRARYLAMEAVKSYDPSRGAKLESHVMNHLQGLRRYSNQSRIVMKQSERKRREYYELMRIEREFYDENGREPSADELSDKLGISPRKLEVIRGYGVRSIGTEAASGGSEGDSGQLGTNMQDPEDIWISYVYHDLSSIDQQIMDWKIGLHGKPQLSNQDIAKRLGISPPAVTQRARRISKKLEEGMQQAELGVQ
jgi:DNA-directed RNA polymerase specialized sigma subunit